MAAPRAGGIKRRDGDGSAPAGRVGLEGPLRAQRRLRWPELVVGLLVVVMCGLVGTWFYVSSVERLPVLVLRADVARGEPLGRDALGVAEVGTDDVVNLVSPDRVADLDGQVALVDLPAGTLVTGDLFVDTAALVAAGDGLVGLALDPGEYPSPALRTGDTVRVVATPVEAGSAPVVVLVEQAAVVDVSTVAGGQDRLFVTLGMPTDEADAVAGAGAEDRVRLIQVGRG